MADAAEFVIRLIDKATGPAKRVSRAMSGIEKAMKPIKKSAVFKALDKAGDKLWDFGKTAVLAGGAIGIGLAGAFTKAAVDAAMFGENTELAFHRLTGSAKAGEQAFSTVKGLVADLGLDLHDTTDGMRKLLAAQFSLGESTELIKMSADLSAIGIHGEEAARVLMALTQIKAKGKVQQEELLQLAEAGVSLSLVQGQLQKALGKSASEVAKLQQAGKISADVGLEAIKAAVKQKLHITEFGEARKAFIDSNLSGMLEQLKSAGQLLFLKLGDSVKEAVVAMKPLVKDTTEWVKTLDTSSVTKVVTTVLKTLQRLIPVGREFLSGFVEGFGVLLDGVQIHVDSESLKSAADAGRSVARAIGMIISAASMAASVLMFFTTPLGKVVAGFGLFVVLGAQVLMTLIPLAAAIATLGLAVAIPVATILGLVVGIGILAAAIWAFRSEIAGAFSAAWETVSGWVSAVGEIFEGLSASMFAIGAAIVDGLIAGLRSMLSVAWDAAAGVGRTVLDAAKSTLGIASPSKEFERLGMFSAEGFQRGLEGNAPQLQTASASALAAPSLSGAASAIGGGIGGPINMPITINVNGSGDPKETAEETFEIFVARLGDAFESITSPSPAEAT